MGRLARIASVVALLNACAEGEIGSTAGGTPRSAERGAPDPVRAPSDGDYDHVIELAGANTATSVIGMINALPAGSVLVRTADGEGTLATINNNLIVPRANAVFYDLHLTGSWTLHDGTGIWAVNGDPFRFKGQNKNNWFIRDSYLSGGAGSTRAEGCVGNVYHQNSVGGLGLTTGWVLENNTFANYMDRESKCSEPDHSETLFISGGAQDGLIRNNRFVGGGSTGFMLLNELGCSDPAACYPRNICMEENTFEAPRENCCYDIQVHPKLEPYLTTHAKSYIDPAQDLEMPGGSYGVLRAACP